MNTQPDDEPPAPANSQPPLNLIAHLTHTLSETFNQFADTFEVDSREADYPDGHKTLVKQITTFQEVVKEADDGAITQNQYNRLHTQTDILAKQTHSLHLKTISIDPDATQADVDAACQHIAAVVGIVNTLQRIVAQSRSEAAPVNRPLPSRRDGYVFTRMHKPHQRDYLRVTDPNGESIIVTPDTIGALRSELYTVDLAL